MGYDCGLELRLLLLCLLVAPPAPPRGSEDELGAKSRLGKELMAAGRYAEAAPVYRELVRAVPGNAGLLLNLGMALHLAGQDEQAIAPLQSALRLQPSSLPAALFLGAAQLRRGRADASVAPLQTAVRLQPDNGDARSMLAQALVGLGRYAEAEPHLRRLSTIAPKAPAAWFNLGKAYEALAGQAFDQLLELDPESPLALALVADARLKQDQRNAAFHLYRKALARDPGRRGLHAAVAEIYRGSGHADWAAVEDEKEKQLARPDCSRDRLECDFAAGRLIEVAAATGAMRSAEAHYWRARAYNELAGRAFGRLSALPPSAESHEWTAQSLGNERRYLESAEEWRRAVALAPRDPRLRLELAVALRLGRDLTGAQKVLEELVAETPDEAQACFLLGDVLLAQDQADRALPLLEKAARLGPDQPQVHSSLGRAYALVGRPAEAIPHLKLALAADADGSVRYQLARCYQATGQAEPARAALADYEAFKKANAPGAETHAQGPPITPP